MRVRVGSFQAGFGPPGVGPAPYEGSVVAISSV